MKTEKEKFPCTFCSRTLTSERILQNHMKKHRLQCRKCVGVVFKTYSDKKEHDKLLHSKNVVQKPGKRCRICPDKVFLNDEDYFIHIQVEHNGKEANYICSDCGKQFRVQGDLTQHNKSKCGTVRRFTCKVCGQKMMTAGSLYNHERRHKGDPSFMCRFCAKLFYTAGQLQVHERIHTKEKAFVCDVCGKGFCHRQSLLTHSSLHTGIKPYVCENCGNSFSCVGNLLKHRKTHADTCGLTPLTTHSVRNPQTKIKVLINTPETSRLKTYSVKMENKMKLELLIQKEQQHNEKEDNNSNLELKDLISEVQNFSIPVPETEKNCNGNIKNLFNTSCAQEVKNDDEINFNNISQKESETDEKRNDVICTFNDMVKKEEINLKSTMKKKTKKKQSDKPSIKRNRVKEVQQFIIDRNLENLSKANCQYCNKEYTSFACLYKHELIDHENDKEKTMFQCNLCEEAYFSKKELKIHKKQVHADLKAKNSRNKKLIKEKPVHSNLPKKKKKYKYICDSCGLEFHEKRFLIEHKDRKCAKRPNFACTVCRKEFKSIRNRNAHMVVHTNNKAFACRFCYKKFHWKNQMKIHERSHTGKKPYTCLFCSKSFAYRDSLITHYTCHTGMKPYFCEACGSRFSCIGNLIKHRMTHYRSCGNWLKNNSVVEK